MDKKRKIQIFFLIGLVIITLLLFNKKSEINDRYQRFVLEYIDKLKTGDIKKIENITADIRLYKKIGEFNTKTCMHNLGEQEIKKLIKEVQTEVEGMLKLTIKEKKKEFEDRMNDACISFGAFNKYSVYFNKIKFLNKEFEDNKIKITFLAFSKLKNKSYKMIAVIINKNGKLLMKNIEFLPKAETFYKK